jgi:hypothetical protein
MYICMSVHQDTHKTILKEDFKRINFLFKCVWCHLKKQKHSIFTCDDRKKDDDRKEKHERVPNWNCQVRDHLKDCAKTFLY